MNYEQLASSESIERVRAALAKGNIQTMLVESGAEALERIKSLIPKGASIMNGASTTLQQIGFVEYLQSGAHGWHNLHEDILAEKDPARQQQLRRSSALSDVFLGSVHAITEAGEVLAASASGSQLGPYAYGPTTILWIASTKKIVPTLNDALARIREYVVPLEDERMKKTGASGTNLSKILIFMKETNPQRKIVLILVNESLGF